MNVIKSYTNKLKTYLYRNYIKDEKIDDEYTLESKNIISNQFFKAKINFEIIRLIFFISSIILDFVYEEFRYTLRYGF